MDTHTTTQKSQFRRDIMRLAQEVRLTRAAFRRAKDPVRCREAVRITRAGLALGLVEPGELTPLPEPPERVR